MFLRNCMTILNSIGHGGINITNALLGQASAQPAGPVSLPIIQAAAPERRNAAQPPAPEERDLRRPASAAPGGGPNQSHHSLAATLMRQIAGIRDQA